ncbi:MAG: EamA family transporter [Desulfocapsaceae bacterium]|jgi:DME family drug/metabolite transporter|nr:EamA family transporter [Desulfocapsaceae bacterium]
MIKGYTLILTAASCWGLIGIFSSVAFSQGVAPMEVAFWRAVLTWFFFAVQVGISKEMHLAKKDIPLLTVFGFLGISVFYVSYLVAVKEGGAAFASVLLYTAPAWVVGCSFFIFGEKLTVFKVAAVVMVIAGVLLISGTGGNLSSSSRLGGMAIFSGLLAGFCYSLYYTIGKYFTSRYSPANLFFYVLPVGALGILPFVDFTHKTMEAWLCLLAVSFVSTFIANYCYYQGLKYLEAGRAAIVATIEPVVAAICAFLILGEYFTPLGYAGAVLIISAVLLTIYRS